MKFLIITFTILLSILTDKTYAVDTDSNLEPAVGSNAEQSSPVDFSNVDFDDDDDDDVAFTSDVSYRKKRYRTKSHKLPYKISDSAIIIKNNKKELDDAKYNEIQRKGIKQIERYEARNNKYSVRVISKILLTNPIPAVRAEAAAALGRMKRGLKALHRAIRTDGYEVRYVAYKSIEQIGSRTSLKYFAYGIHAKDLRIAIASYHGLGKTRTRYGRKLILKYGLKSNQPSLVAAALSALGYYGYRSDLQRFEQYLLSSSMEEKAGAVRGLKNHRSSASLDILMYAFERDKSLEADIIFAIAKKRTLSATLSLIKIMNATRNENYKAVIERELLYRKAYGRYAIVQFKVATIRKNPRPRSTTVTRLLEKDVARIKKVTYKRYKARLNGRIVEDRYYLLQAVQRGGKYRGRIVNGWVFGPKIKVITIRNPKSSYSYKRRPAKTSAPKKSSLFQFKEVTPAEYTPTYSSPNHNSLIENNLKQEESLPKFTNESIENDQDEDVIDE
ncbi:MAG: HEAT repeat domain-containing protein [Spirochaetota bacterium]